VIDSIIAPHWVDHQARIDKTSTLPHVANVSLELSNSPTNQILEAFVTDVRSGLQYPKANKDNEEEDWA
jgi:hypothetical protein